MSGVLEILNHFSLLIIPEVKKQRQKIFKAESFLLQSITILYLYIVFSPAFNKGNNLSYYAYYTLCSYLFILNYENRQKGLHQGPFN